MKNTTTLPVVQGMPMDALAMLVADRQDEGAPISEYKPLAIEYYRRMRVVCKRFVPLIDKNNPDRWDTLCRSGVGNHKLRMGEACYECQAFNADALPTAGRGSSRLVQLSA